MISFTFICAVLSIITRLCLVNFYHSLKKKGTTCDTSNRCISFLNHNIRRSLYHLRRDEIYYIFSYCLTVKARVIILIFATRIAVYFENVIQGYVFALLHRNVGVLISEVKKIKKNTCIVENKITKTFLISTIRCKHDEITANQSTSMIKSIIFVDICEITSFLLCFYYY